MERERERERKREKKEYLVISDRSTGGGGVQVTAEPAASPRDERTGDRSARGGTGGAQTAHQQTGEQTGAAEGLRRPEARDKRAKVGRSLPDTNRRTWQELGAPSNGTLEGASTDRELEAIQHPGCAR